MGTFAGWLETLKDLLEVRLLDLGETRLTLWTLLHLTILLVVFFYLSGKLRSWIADRLLARGRVRVGTRQAMGTVIWYAVLFIGILIILQTAGIDVTTLQVLAGAVGIGVGFGLQNIANNFISGLIILFEGPIKVGDRIEVGDVEGDVIGIGARSTTVVTNDNIAIIVPNSKFISENVVNWSHTDEKVRFKIPVSVAYGANLELVEEVLLAAAGENPDVLDHPPPAVRFLEFGDSGLQFELRVWSTTLMHRKGTLISALNFAVYAKFKEQGIEIPYPQRDLHIRSGALDVRAPSTAA